MTMTCYKCKTEVNYVFNDSLCAKCTQVTHMALDKGQRAMTDEFTEEDIDNCWPYYKSYFLQILNGEYSVEDARDDLKSLIGSQWDEREIDKEK